MFPTPPGIPCNELRKMAPTVVDIELRGIDMVVVHSSRAPWLIVCAISTTFLFVDEGHGGEL